MSKKPNLEKAKAKAELEALKILSPLIFFIILFLGIKFFFLETPLKKTNSTPQSSRMSFLKIN